MRRSTACVDEQAAVAEVRHAGRCVRPAREVDARHQLRIHHVADVDDVQALEPGRQVMAVALLAGSCGDVPGAHEHVAPDHHA
jgi:hypothetical protein